MARRLNSVREQRQRALARRRPNKWLTAPVDPPPQEVLEFADWRMGVVDSMPPQWRALVRYYGFERVNALYAPGADVTIAWGQLEALKQRRQQELLDADYLPKTNRGKPP